MSELKVLGAATRAVFGRAVSESVGFSTTRTSSYGAVVLGLSLATAFEMVALHLGIGHFLGEGYGWLHAAVTMVHLYGALWILGDWRLMKETGHRVEGDRLRVALGQRWRAEVPLEQVASVKTGEVEPLDVMSGQRRPAHVVVVSPMDAPNLTVCLRGPVSLTTYMGFTKEATELQLFVDEPHALAKALAAEPSSV